MNPGWEYHVREFGSALRRAKPEEVESVLNESATDGWELSQMTATSNGSKIMIVLRRKVLKQNRKRKRTWPEW